MGRLECDISTVGGVARTDIGERAGYNVYTRVFQKYTFSKKK